MAKKRKVDWHGVMTAVVTPFDAKGRIDEAAYKRNVDLCIGYGCTGIVPSGCGGESWALTTDEKKRVFKLSMDAAKGRVPVIAGTGGTSTAESIELGEYAKSIGCDGAMILAPYFPKLADDDLYGHYKMISDAVDMPIMVYNVPGYNPNELKPELISRLADLENVVAIKEATTEFAKFHWTLRLAGDRIKVMTGQLSVYGVAAVSHGAVGAVTTVPQVWGAESIEYYNLCVKGDTERAIQLERKAVDLWHLYHDKGRTLYCSIKAGMNLQGLPGGYPRPPLRPILEPDLTEIRIGMEQMGFKIVSRAAAE